MYYANWELWSIKRHHKRVRRWATHWKKDIYNTWNSQKLGHQNILKNSYKLWKKTNTIEKWTKDMNRQVTEEQTKMAKEKMNRISQGNAKRIPREMPFHIPLTVPRLGKDVEQHVPQCQRQQNWQSFRKTIWDYLVKVHMHRFYSLVSLLLDTQLKSDSQTLKSSL